MRIIADDIAVVFQHHTRNSPVYFRKDAAHHTACCGAGSVFGIVGDCAIIRTVVDRDSCTRYDLSGNTAYTGECTAPLGKWSLSLLLHTGC